MQNVTWPAKGLPYPGQVYLQAGSSNGRSQPKDGCFILLLSNPVQNFYAIWGRTEGEEGNDRMAEPYTEVVAVRMVFLELQANMSGQGNCEFQA